MKIRKSPRKTQQERFNFKEEEEKNYKTHCCWFCFHHYYYHHNHHHQHHHYHQTRCSNSALLRIKGMALIG